MKTFLVSENKSSSSHRQKAIEARDSQEAIAKFKTMEVLWDNENTSTGFSVHETMGSQMAGGNGVAYPMPPDGVARANY